MRLFAQKHAGAVKRPLRLILFWFFIWLLIPCTILLLGELLVRLLWGDRINVQSTTATLYLPGAYSPRTSGWRPGAAGSSYGKPVRINSLGLRGAEISLSKTDFHVILLPYEFQLRNSGADGIWRPQELMADSLRAMGIPYLEIDHLPTINGNTKALYLFADGIHFSAAGHREIAPPIITYLTSLER